MYLSEIDDEAAELRVVDGGLFEAGGNGLRDGSHEE